MAYLEVEGLPPGTRCTTRTRPLPNRKRWRRAPLPVRSVGQFQAASGLVPGHANWLSPNASTR